MGRGFYPVAVADLGKIIINVRHLHCLITRTSTLTPRTPQIASHLAYVVVSGRCYRTRLLFQLLSHVTPHEPENLFQCAKEYL
jgi:hypothetical protein